MNVGRVFFGLTAIALAACGGGGGGGAGLDARLPADIEIKTLPAAMNRDLDILFVVDNSDSMQAAQTSLIANFQQFISVIKSVEGGLPNLHIGVATTDMGTSNGGSAGGCVGNGDNGGLKTGGLAFTGGVNYINDVADPATPGARITNYPTESMGSAFSKTASVGVSGCGFEQPLLASVAALSSPANAGFLRDSAYLLIVYLSDEDDCSMKLGGSLLGTDPALGPLTSFRCTEFGVICDGVDDMHKVGARKGCKPRDNSAYETKISDLVTAIKNKKGTRGDKQIIVASIAAPSEPFAIGQDTTMTPAIPSLDPACTYNAQGAMQSAAPAVRINALLSSFKHHSQNSICQDFATSMTNIGRQLKTTMGSGCFDSNLLEPLECDVADVTDPTGANATTTAMPACDATKSVQPCWRVETDATKCPAPATGSRIVLERSVAAPPGTITTVSCKIVK